MKPNFVSDSWPMKKIEYWIIDAGEIFLHLLTNFCSSFNLCSDFCVSFAIISFAFASKFIFCFTMVAFNSTCFDSNVDAKSRKNACVLILSKVGNDVLNESFVMRCSNKVSAKYFFNGIRSDTFTIYEMSYLMMMGSRWIPSRTVLAMNMTIAFQKEHVRK